MLTLRLLIATCLLSAVVNGQEQLQISGVVSDIAGNPLEGAHVTIVERPDAPPVRTEATGRFEFRNLTTGHYTVRVTLQGFRPQARVLELGGRSENTRVEFALPLDVLIEGLAVRSEPVMALRQSAAVAHIRLDGLAPPMPCGNLVVVSAVHDATVLAVWRGKLPKKIQVLQDSAGSCLDGARIVSGLNPVRASGSQYVVFLTGSGGRFNGVGNSGYAFPVVEDRVTTYGEFGLADTVSLDQFRTALQRLAR